MDSAGARWSGCRCARMLRGRSGQAYQEAPSPPMTLSCAPPAATRFTSSPRGSDARAGRAASTLGRIDSVPRLPPSRRWSGLSRWGARWSPGTGCWPRGSSFTEVLSDGAGGTHGAPQPGGRGGGTLRSPHRGWPGRAGPVHQGTGAPRTAVISSSTSSTSTRRHWPPTAAAPTSRSTSSAGCSGSSRAARRASGRRWTSLPARRERHLAHRRPPRGPGRAGGEPALGRRRHRAGDPRSRGATHARCSGS